jgi:Transposase DDE domain
VKNYIQKKNPDSVPKVCYGLQKVGREKLYTFVEPLLEELNKLLDIRLVRTFYQLLECMLVFQHVKHGLLLSRLGGFLLGPSKAPAGTKRISNLLRNVSWTYHMIVDFLQAQAIKHLQQFEALEDELPLLLWDDSIVEKPESIELEGLTAVRSSKFHRLVRIKKGFYDPPTRKPAFVPGFQWCGLMLMGLAVRPCVFAFEFWSQRGKNAVDRERVHLQMLFKAAHTFGDAVVHVFDRGFASLKWVKTLADKGLRFIIRWKGNYKLMGVDGSIRKTYLWSVGRKPRSVRRIWDAVTGNFRQVSVLWHPVRHPEYPEQPLYLIICRPGKKGRKPWYLLTTEEVETPQQAWKIVFAYARRWQIEMAFRFNKAELAIESPRLWFEENRKKLLLMVTLLYAYLLSMLDLMESGFITVLLRYGDHRTGKRCKSVLTPLYRIRTALAYIFSLPDQNSG